jgi:hypothetical protein
MKTSEFLKRNTKRSQSLYTIEDRETIIDRANERGFFVTVGNRLFRATITGTRLFYPQVIIPATGQIFTITWHKAHLLSQGATSLRFL